MTDKYKILVVLLVVLSTAILSCKEEEIIAGIAGCTDGDALNYLFNATSNDGSCIYAYEIAQGTWGLKPDCSDLPIPIPVFSVNDLIPDSINVESGGGDTLYIDMNGSNFTGVIDSAGNILVDEQTISIDFSGATIPVQVSGDGMIESANTGYMDLKYSGMIDFIAELPIPVPFNITCNIDLEK